MVRGIPRIVVANVLDHDNHGKRVQTSAVQVRLLSDQYNWGRHEPSDPPTGELKSPTIAALQRWLWR